MRFVKDGPDIPVELLEAQEEGRLVFFCGAGVSVPAGLPLFPGLVEQVRQDLRDRCTSPEVADELDRENYDRVLGLLERDDQYGKRQVRESIMRKLELAPDADLDMHRHVLTLAKTRTEKFRLVTTNVDQAFQRLSEECGAILDAAPKLPVPKDFKWNSVVHLHGLIDKAHDPDGENMVMTSADFGAAYLTEGWAARFVTELFRHYNVLFIGYSVDDPVMRYVLDALAVDRNQGMKMGEAYAFASFSSVKGHDQKTVEREWKAKNVEPILFNQRNRFVLLKRTMAKWASSYRAGLTGRIEVVQQSGRRTPVPPFDQDDKVQQVLWALTDVKNGVAYVAKLFADLNDPPAPLEWMEVFEKKGLLKLASHEWNSNSPVPIVSSMYGTYHPPKLHPVTFELCRWITNFIDDPKVIDWVINCGGYMHPQAKRLFARNIDKEGYGRILRDFWRIVTSDAYDVGACPSLGWRTVNEWPQWQPPCFGQMKSELLMLLTPHLRLCSSIRFGESEQKEKDRNSLANAKAFGEIADCVVGLRAGPYSKQLCTDILRIKVVQEILPDLADDITTLLKRVFDLYALCGQSTRTTDMSCIYHPSIATHEQNNYTQEWCILVDLLRESFDALFKSRPSEAKTLVERWRHIPYPIFKRFVMYAFTSCDHYPPKVGLKFILSEGGWWFWSPYTSHEVTELTNKLWPQLSQSQKQCITDMIRLGPPRSLYENAPPETDWQDRRDRSVWSKLEQLREKFGDLPESAQQELHCLEKEHHKWQLSKLDKTGFAVFMDAVKTGFDSIFTPERLLAMSDKELTRVLREHVNKRFDGTLQVWADAAAKNHQRAISFLEYLRNNKIWNGGIWSTTIAGLKPSDSCINEWDKLAPLLLTVRKIMIKKNCRNLAFRLNEYSKVLPPESDQTFLQVWDRLYDAALTTKSDTSIDVFTTAINTPLGILTDALLNRVSAWKPKSDQTLAEISPALAERFTKLATGTSPNHRYARIELCTRLYPLYTIDPVWTRTFLLPRLQWTSPETADAWNGYLRHPGISPNFLSDIKDSLIKTMTKQDCLEGSKMMLPTLVALICFANDASFSRDEQANLLEALDVKGLEEVAKSLYQFTKEAEKPKLVWTEKIEPILRLWPKIRTKNGPGPARFLTLITLLAEDHFPQAMKVLTPLLVPIITTDWVVTEINNSKYPYPTSYPKETLMLLGRIIDTTHSDWVGDSLREILDKIAEKKPSLKNDLVYKRLDEFLRRQLP